MAKQARGRYQCQQCPAASDDWRVMTEHKTATGHIIRDTAKTPREG